MKNFFTGILMLTLIAFTFSMTEAKASPDNLTTVTEDISPGWSETFTGTIEAKNGLLAQAELSEATKLYLAESNYNYDGKISATLTYRDNPGLLASNDKPTETDVYSSNLLASNDLFKVDTIESVSDIVDQGTYYVKNTPKKGSSVMDWIGWVIGLLGVLYGAYVYFTRPKTPEQNE